MAEVLRAEAKTAGNSQRACKPRASTAAPLVGPPPEPSEAGPVGRRRGKGAQCSFRLYPETEWSGFRPDAWSGPAGPAIFGYFPSLESNPPEAGPENKHHQSNEEEAEGNPQTTLFSTSAA